MPEDSSLTAASLNPTRPINLSGGINEPLNMSETPATEAQALGSPEQPKTFAELGLSKPILETLNAHQFHIPTPIQRQAIPIILSGRDVVGKAETGTGKTFAFSLPLLMRLDPSRVSTQALILAPTRELAHQIVEALTIFTANTGLRVVSVVGGESQAGQLIEIKKGAQIVVGTPGRVMDFAGTGYLALEWVEVVVLDEADRMLDMGFIDQITAILDRTPPERQTLLFSATFEPALKRIAQKYMRDPATIETSRGLKTSATIDQKFVRIRSGDKTSLLRSLIEASEGMASIVFLNRKRDVASLGRELWNRGYKVLALHGDMEQAMRNRVLEDFRLGKYDVLIATDVAQRGLDVDRVERVINFEVPRNPEDYVHRIGRTGRAGRKGMVLTLVDSNEWRDFKAILDHVGGQLGELPLPNRMQAWDQADAGKRSSRPGGYRDSRNSPRHPKPPAGARRGADRAPKRARARG